PAAGRGARGRRRLRARRGARRCARRATDDARDAFLRPPCRRRRGGRAVPEDAEGDARGTPPARARVMTSPATEQYAWRLTVIDLGRLEYASALERQERAVDAVHCGGTEALVVVERRAVYR